MYKRPSSNPFGEWNKIPSIENTSINEQAEFVKKWEDLCTEELTESEVTNYLEKLNTVALNEMGGYAERGWFGVSPFAWTEGFKIGSIFKPLKWLALPLIGGTVLLLAGIWKLLKEGKKQIAIARVRAWIQKLVVLADSGLKKTRDTKDSLFLIRQRYRRDILQNAVKVATCLGIDVQEKDTKPESVETSLNESSTGSVGKLMYIANSPGANITLEFDLQVNGDTRRVELSINYNKNGSSDIRFRVAPKQGEILNNDSPIVIEAHDTLLKAWNPGNGNILDKLISDSERSSLDLKIGDSLEEIADKYSQEPRENVQEPEENQEMLDNDENENNEPNIKTPAGIPSQVQLPDDSRVDWSLMNSVKASQWFGLKHKTTNFWKEAKSVGMINTTQANGNELRECGLIVSYVSQSLSLIANAGVAKQYASTMNKYIEAITKTYTDIESTNGSATFNNRFRQMESYYKMFDEDFKIFEALSPEDQRLIDRMKSNPAFSNFLISNFHGINPRDYFFKIENGEIQLDDLKNKFMFFTMMNKMDDLANNPTNKSGHHVPGLNVNNIDKYLIAALGKILANTNFNEWQMHSDAYNQMMKFINELTKTVHTVIDSVAKKVEEKMSNSGNSFEQAVLRFVSSKPDAKQNRSLKNLWDNIGVSKLQQRTIVHCQEIDASPEMQYYLDMFMITVPSVIKSKLISHQEQATESTTEDSSANTQNGN